MTEQYAGALLYLVPVVVAAVVAFIVTRPEKPVPSAPALPLPDAPANRATDPGHVARPLRIPVQRTTYQPPNNRRATPAPPPSPTLLHAALSSHFAAVAGSATSASATSTSAPASAMQPVIRPPRLVSIRKPARIPRRPVHRCRHKP